MEEDLGFFLHDLAFNVFELSAKETAVIDKESVLGLAYFKTYSAAVSIAILEDVIFRYHYKCIGIYDESHLETQQFKRSFSTARVCGSSDNGRYEYQLEIQDALGL